MKNLLDQRWRDSVFLRLDRLESASEPKWGRMNVEQMICHIGDPIRIALGEKEVADVSTFMTRNVLRWLVLSGMPAPKGVKTFPEVDQVDGSGTPPTSLDQDREAFKTLVERLVTEAPKNPLTPSPGFGKLSGRQYGRLFYCHTHHHLKQFGV